MDPQLHFAPDVAPASFRTGGVPAEWVVSAGVPADVVIASPSTARALVRPVPGVARPSALFVLLPPHASVAAQAVHWLANGARWVGSGPLPAAHVDALVRPFIGPVWEGEAVTHPLFERAERFLADEIPPATRELVVAFCASLAIRDAYTGGHAHRVALMSVMLGLVLGYPRRALERLAIAASLHDIGKLGLSDAVLRKTTALDQGDRLEIETHPGIGADLAERHPLLREVAVAIRQHHEQWDGRGYPFRLAASDICQDARIIAVADTVDAITSDRPYRAGRPWVVAMEELRRCRGAQFDPGLVDVALAVFAEDDTSGSPPLSRSLAWAQTGF